MSADIRLSVGFWDHPKTRKLIKRLGLESVRSLQILWMWCAQNRPNGVLTGMDAEDIELSAQWDGEEGKFFKVLLELHWIDETPDGHVLHEWEQHNPWASGTESRSGKARLSRLSQIAPAAYRQCVADGKTELTPAEYAALKDSTPATEQRNASETPATVCNTFGESPANASATPAPSPSPSLTLNTKNKEYIYSAKSPAIAPEMEPAFPASGDAEHEQTAPIELIGKNKTLTGKRAESFLRFWDAFGYKKGRAEAIDAWSKIPELTDSLVEKIISAALKCAEQRKHILAKGGTPKMAEGWITGKRWEDEITNGLDKDCPPCPGYGLWMQIYNDELPMLQPAKMWEAGHEMDTQNAWLAMWKSGRFTNAEEGIAFLHRYFRHVQECPELMGQPLPGKDPFYATFDWLIYPRNCANVINGKYERRDA